MRIEEIEGNERLEMKKAMEWVTANKPLNWPHWDEGDPMGPIHAIEMTLKITQMYDDEEELRKEMKRRQAQQRFEIEMAIHRANLHHEKDRRKFFEGDWLRWEEDDGL